MTLDAFRSRVDVKEYQTFLTADGLPAGEVAWLRNTEREGQTYKAGMWRAGVSEAPYYFAADETFVMIEGVLRIKMENGQTLEFGPGDTASFVKGTNSTWMVVEAGTPLLHSDYLSAGAGGQRRGGFGPIQTPTLVLTIVPKLPGVHAVLELSFAFDKNCGEVTSESSLRTSPRYESEGSVKARHDAGSQPPFSRKHGDFA